MMPEITATATNRIKAQHHWNAMGTSLAVSVELRQSSEQAAQALIGNVVERVARSEQCLSRFRSDSELSRLNESSGNWIPVSPLMWTMLQAAETAYEHSGGLVNVRILPLLEAWGYDRSFERVRDGSGESPSRMTQTGSALGDGPGFELGTEHCSVRILPGARIDLGGIAKGLLADLILRDLLEELGSSVRRCALDMGGDLRAWSAGDSWTVDVPHARDPQRTVLCVEGADLGIATSSTLRRSWSRGSKAGHHIIDPRTGAPSESDLVQVSAWADTALDAEVEAKTLLLLGCANAEARYVRGEAPGLKGAVVWSADGTAQLYSGGEIYELHID